MSQTLAQMVATAQSQTKEIAPQQAAEDRTNAEFGFIIDVREPNEFNQSHLPGAVLIPRGMLELRADPSSPVADARLSAAHAARILVYCTKGPGARSLMAAQTLGTMGFERVEVLRGGLVAWEAAGLPLEGDDHPAAAPAPAMAGGCSAPDTFSCSN